MKRLVIIEDLTAIREMLTDILKLDANYQVAGEAGDGQSAVQLCLETNPDVIVLDAKLPGLNGVDILRRTAKKLPHIRVLVFSGHENPVLIREMLEDGAHGFVEKRSASSSSRRASRALPTAALTSARPSRRSSATSSPIRPAEKRTTSSPLASVRFSNS